MRDGERGFRTEQQRGCNVTLCSRDRPGGRGGCCCSLSFLQPLISPSSPSSLLLAQHISTTRTHSRALWRNARFSSQKAECLPAAQVLPRAPFVYSTSSIMQGLISQSRFELQHAWTKRAGSRTFVPVEVSPSHWLRGRLLFPLCRSL